jgi:hypothetical protein
LSTTLTIARGESTGVAEEVVTTSTTENVSVLAVSRVMLGPAAPAATVARPDVEEPRGRGADRVTVTGLPPALSVKVEGIARRAWDPLPSSSVMLALTLTSPLSVQLSARLTVKDTEVDARKVTLATAGVTVMAWATPACSHPPEMWDMRYPGGHPPTAGRTVPEPLLGLGLGDGLGEAQATPVPAPPLVLTQVIPSKEYAGGHDTPETMTLPLVLPLPPAFAQVTPLK